MEKGFDVWWELIVEEFLLEVYCNNGCIYCKGEDIMDVWFDFGFFWVVVVNVKN